MTRLLLGGGGVDPYVLCWVHVIDKLDMRLVRTKECNQVTKITTSMPLLQDRAYSSRLGV